MVETGSEPDPAGLIAATRCLGLADSAPRTTVRSDLALRLRQLVRTGAGAFSFGEAGRGARLLRAGANGGEINTVRKHLPWIKGGRLTRRAHPSRFCRRYFGRSGDDPPGSARGQRARSDHAVGRARHAGRFNLITGKFVSGSSDARALAEAGRPDFRGAEYRLAERPIDVFDAARRDVEEANTNASSSVTGWKAGGANGRRTPGATRARIRPHKAGAPSSWRVANGRSR
jgi:hydroxypyruvate reductase